VMFFLGAPAVLVGILWLFTGREPKKGEIPEAVVSKVPFREAFAVVSRNRQVWIFGLIQLCFMGCMTGMGGYLAIYLRDIGWSNISADTALTMTSVTGIVGSLPMVMLASRLRSTRGVFILSMVVTTVSLAMLPFANTPGVWLILILGGVLRSAAPALSNTMVLEIDGIGGKYAGTAMGLVTSLGMLGAFAAPPLGNKLTSISPGAPFIFWAVLAAVSIPVLLTFGKSSREKRMAAV
jgi:MFS transporter, NNP family, nitrate/nitrite transporter